MPLVIVRYDPNILPEGNSDSNIEMIESNEKYYFAQLSDKLPAIVAEALHTPTNPDGHLIAGDIAVDFQPYSKYASNTISFSILILANDYTERRENLEERKEQILQRLQDLFNDSILAISVWVLLAPGAYGRREH